MIIREDKSFETNSLFPNTDWYDDGRTLFVVDETTEVGVELKNKIMQNYPHFEFVLDETGYLIDIVLTEKPIVIQEPTVQERIDAMEMLLIELI